MKSAEDYLGFELGPVRPPSEAESLKLRVTRNCPWNKCRFCGLYRGKKFSIRPLSHIIKDIDMIRKHVDYIQRAMELSVEYRRIVPTDYPVWPENEKMAFQSALKWCRNGMKSIFLQDADAMTVRPDDLVALLHHVRKAFPRVERVTSYARSRSIMRISDEDMVRMADAGLNRIHIGMESGSDEVLGFVNKGADKKTHIAAGRKVKRSGMELSEYFMPGLGGKQYSEENARETADAMNQIAPDFIRIRTLAVPDNTDLFQDCRNGPFNRLGDVQMVEELLLFLENLDGISSVVKSDQILNLLEEVEGRLPDDKERMTEPIRKFLAMEPEAQMVFIVGRRTGVFSKLDDMNNPELRNQAVIMGKTCRVNLDNVEDFAAEMRKRFI